MRTTTRYQPLGIEPDDIHDEYDRFAAADLSDAQLFDRAARVVAIPKQDVANSFILHAPLELMARRLLLPLVAPRYRRAVRERILWVAASYDRAGAGVEPPPEAPYRSVDDARHALLDALEAGDLDRLDAAAVQFLHDATLDQVMTLAAPTVRLLAAAGHAPIGFFLASRLAATSRSSVALLRPTFRELARAPQLRVEWIDAKAEPTGDARSFIAALAQTSQLGLPGSDFIFPIVHQVDVNGLARTVINESMPSDVTAAASATLQIAARSMLQDDPKYAPYGWTHCLTLPHAIFEIMPWLPDAHTAAAIAATYVVGFRAAASRSALDVDWRPEPAPMNLVDALDAEPRKAAAAWYHASDAARSEALPVLIGSAASHEDAHLAKYTLACLAAAERDRAHRSLYVAAAAALAAWWRLHGATAFRDDHRDAGGADRRGGGGGVDQ